MEPQVRLTPSGIEELQACPLRYNLLYLQPRNIRQQKSSPQLSFGISVHECLYRFHEGGGHEAYAPEQIPGLLGQSWVANGYSDDDEQNARRAEAVEICTRYYETVKAEPTQNLGNELFLQASVRLDNCNLLVSGKIDRLSAWPEGWIEIVDYKTAAGSPPSPEKLACSPAAFLYYLLVRANHRDCRDVRVSYLYLRDMTKVTAIYSKELLIERKAELSRLVNQVMTGSFAPKPNSHCAWCEFKPLCPAMAQDEISLDEF